MCMCVWGWVCEQRKEGGEGVGVGDGVLGELAEMDLGSVTRLCD